MEVVAANWRCPMGELDLILFDAEELVFVEVKSRKASASIDQDIFASLTAKKKQKLRVLAQVFLGRYFRENTWPAFRIDAVGVIIKQDLNMQSIRHLRGVI